ncbi:hypothetical protein SAMN04488550_0951 [Gordonia malaquae]|uniref:Tox-REase-5 domain-containing protein n=1 Tax=Gordonia malaquae NBRC 108250 TaxID=1223542 RepID=M3TIS2_GORML|nr:hypothetical protein [Gordonia malaquae]GAC81421.1 hypothetical protein GM1_034_00080 [Gordonia malaquae NBRC 108250]SEB88124.1 hypothetical protein SAMN04488550_0951 [Gordonia malaquae]
MRKKLIIAGGAAAAVAVLLGVTLSGVLAPSMDGTPAPNEAMRALQGVNAASLSLAEAPGATYDGTITLGTGSKSTIDITKMTVTATGDLRGKVRQGGGSAEVLQIGNLTLVKGDSAFWTARPGPRQPAGVLTEKSLSDKWVTIGSKFLDVDLGVALLPSRLGLLLGQQDAILGDAEVTGTNVGRLTETPDRRVASGTDRPNITEVEVEDADGGVAGTRRFTASSMSIGVDDTGALAGLRGPIGPRVEADLRVTPATSAAVRDFYSSAKSAVAEGRIGSSTMTIGDPTGSLDCNGPTCSINYDLTNANSGLVGGTVTIGLTTDFKAVDRKVGSCSGSGTMPINGRGHVACTIRYTQTSDMTSQSRFTVTVNGTVDPVAIDAAATTGNRIAEAAKGWEMTAPKVSEPARRYNRQITHAPSGYTLKVGGFNFDGRASDGTLLLSYGVGYDGHLLPDGAIDPAWQGTEQVLSQARDALAAAGDTQVRLVFAEQRAADAVNRMLIANKLERVQVVFVPLNAEA